MISRNRKQGVVISHSKLFTPICGGEKDKKTYFFHVVMAQNARIRELLGNLKGRH